jgi:hypothetical protein
MDFSSPYGHIKMENGNYYQIINKNCGRALSISSNSRNLINIAPILLKPNENDIDQVWMIEEVQ